MRDFLNGILSFIVQTSLTDEEFASCTSTIPIYDQNTYNDLANVLENRSAVTVVQDRLVAYYKARGVDVSPNDTAKSNVLLGMVLD